MSSLVIFSIATIALILPLNVDRSVAAQAIDINQIIDLLQKNQNSGNSKQSLQRFRKESSSDNSGITSDFSTDTSNDVGAKRARKDEIIDLIEKIANENKNPKENLKIYRKGKSNHRSEKYANSKQSNFPTHILDQIFSQGLIEEERKQKSRGDYPKKRLKPNQLTGNTYLSQLSGNGVREHSNNNRFDDNIGLDDYSKVYIVLNPQAVRQTKNKDSLNELISQVLALSSSQTKKVRQGKRNQHRYKGFVVKDDNLLKRSRRDSKDSYRGKERGDSREDDEYKPKRSRGGFDPGHTAIPYIKHRGDVYEKDD